MTRRARRRTDDRGQMTGLIAILAIGLIAVAGMAYDGGQFIRSYTEASDLAEAAARAGAQAVPQESLLAGAPSLDAAAAQARVDEFLAAAGHPDSGTVSINGNQVTVTVTLQQEAHILPIPPHQVTAQASATPTRGIDTQS
jgi:uncharacterized iron-regulated membrane protein